MTAVTDIRDARALREIGAPLNTPVIEKTFSPQMEKRINDVAKAMASFRKRIDSFFDNINASGFNAMRRAHDKLAYLIRKGTVLPEWKDGDDDTREMVNHEQVAAALYIEKFTVCIAGWQEIFDAADEASNAGEPLSITDEQVKALWPFNGKHIMRPDETP
jgi:hypothetical protein